MKLISNIKVNGILFLNIVGRVTLKTLKINNVIILIMKKEDSLKLFAKI